ncbi:MAG: chorismate-binding protein [bacterium]
MRRLRLAQACFPAGTLSGAPKIRALKSSKLEPVRRGPTERTVEYIDFAGNLDAAITIRSVAIDPKHLYIQAGAGLVYDSVPKSEYVECRQGRNDGSREKGGGG